MIEQRTDEWLEIRAGKFTGSEIHKLMGKRGIGQTGETYILSKVAQQLGAHLPPVSSKEMEYGVIMEPFAKMYYERAFGVTIEEQPFFVARWCEEAGCSPDGFIKSLNRGIEIKCPYNPANHVQNLMIKTSEQFKELRPEYYWQIQMCMAVCECDSWDFVSYSEEFKGRHRMMAIEIQANDEDIQLMKSRIFEAVQMKNEILKRINQ